MAVSVNALGAQAQFFRPITRLGFERFGDRVRVGGEYIAAFFQTADQFNQGVGGFNHGWLWL